MPTVKIAAIDNGLAFPFKHPDEWRACLFIIHSLKLQCLFLPRVYPGNILEEGRWRSKDIFGYHTGRKDCCI